MIIEKDVLAEKNYTGSRLVLIENEKVDEFSGKLNELQQEINPILDKLAKEYYPVVDPIYQEVQRLTKLVAIEKDKIAVITESFKTDTDAIESLEQKATLIKNKIQPIIMKELDGKLGEFEIARHTTVKDGKIYVEVFDEIEEKVKQLRAIKVKK